MSALIVESHRGVDAFRELEPEWKALRERAGASPFLSWEWAASWSRHLGASHTPRILSAREGGELVGLLALSEEGRRIPGVSAPITRLGFVGERHGGADYLDVLAPPEQEARVVAALLDHLAEARDFDLLELDGIATDSATVEALRFRFEDDPRYKLRATPRYTCPQIPLLGGFDKVLSRSSRADNFKRRLRQLRAVEGFEFRQVHEPEAVGAAFERFLLLHERRWHAQGGSDAMGRPALRAFHREVVPALAAAGILRFDELWAEGDCRASIYGMDTPGVYRFYQSGYDPAWSRRSVGLVALGLSIEQAASRGARVYDFLHGLEPYKLEWASGSRETVSIRIASAGLGASILLLREAAEAVARTAAHSLLPAAAVDRLRRRRRAREQEGLH